MATSPQRPGGIHAAGLFFSGILPAPSLRSGGPGGPGGRLRRYSARPLGLAELAQGGIHAAAGAFLGGRPCPPGFASLATLWARKLTHMGILPDA